MKTINILINIVLAIVIAMHIIILSSEDISMDNYVIFMLSLAVFSIALIIVDMFMLIDYTDKRKKSKHAVIDTGWIRRAMKVNPHKNTIVRENLMNEDGYVPYCGNHKCLSMPRTFFNGEQFECPACGFISEFPIEFIREYKKKWGIE